MSVSGGYGRHHHHHHQEMDPVIKLKLMIDKARNRVIFAEADHEFVDVIFSFLTLPLGSVLNLVEDGVDHMGSISQIYGSLSSLKAKHFRTERCKHMLLRPLSAAEALLKQLKININPNPMQKYAGKFYLCPYCNEHSSEDVRRISVYHRAQCGVCGSSMDSVFDVREKDDGTGNGVFVKGGSSSFIVTDDLQIFPSSMTTIIALFKKLEVDDDIKVEEKTVEIRTNEVQQLLKFSLLSKSALTNTFLLKQDSWVIDTIEYKHRKAVKTENKVIDQNSSMTMKLLVRKSDRLVLLAEAGVDVIDLLLSFLVFPLGAVIKLLGNSSGLGCIDNLYRGAQELSSANYIKSRYKAMLVSPKLAPHFSFENHQLQMNEYVQFVNDGHGFLSYATDATVEQGVPSSDGMKKSFQFIDPKSPTGGETESGKGYLKAPATYMITQKLVLTPFSPLSCIAMLNRSNISISNVEERVVTIGKEEALNMLRGSLVSKFALRDVFNL